MHVDEADQIRDSSRPRLRRSSGGAPTAVGQPARALPCSAVADQAHIRNFSIIAHIDHGKSTLADRILEMTKTVDPRSMRAQVLDSMDLERERGITIKAQAVRVLYEARDGETYQLHLIDTPGHVDFTYEVSRSLAACEGALLVVDASQGVEAQTLANTYLAIEGGLELIPVLNKLDLPGAEPERVAEEVADLLGEPMDDILRISGKTGEGVVDVLEQLVAQVPPPAGDPDAPPRALIFDSEFDQYRGVIAYIRVVDGVFRKGDAISAMAGDTEADIDDIGFFTPAMVVTEQLSAGEVGFLITGIKEVSALAVGDTLTTKLGPAQPSRCPATATSSRSSSAACFRSTPTSTPTCATRSRSSRSTTPRCRGSPRCPRRWGSAFAAASSACCTWTSCASAWSASTTSSSWRRCRRCASTSRSPTSSEMEVHIPSDFPDPGRIKEIREPMIEASILTPKEYIGPIMELCIERRGTHKGMHYLTADRVQLTYDLPLREIVIDFFDALKSRTRGYASLDYELRAMRSRTWSSSTSCSPASRSTRCRWSCTATRPTTSGATWSRSSRRRSRASSTTSRSRPRSARAIIARETVKAYRKDVIAGCYGGDISRKRKLLEKQKEGKKRMKQVGRIEVPQEAFLAVLELGD